MLYMLERLAALLLLVLWTPVLGVIGLLIKLTSPGSVIYSQVRLGKGGASSLFTNCAACL
jgi:lipopolysaccharide/colanic/teichoic acid biosynthesis glycosyltransferase